MSLSFLVVVLQRQQQYLKLKPKTLVSFLPPHHRRTFLRSPSSFSLSSSSTLLSSSSMMMAMDETAMKSVLVVSMSSSMSPCRYLATRSTTTASSSTTTATTMNSTLQQQQQQQQYNYNDIFTNYIQRGEMKQALGHLQELQTLFQSTLQSKYCPDITLVNIILSGWLQQGQEQVVVQQQQRNSRTLRRRPPSTKELLSSSQQDPTSNNNNNVFQSSLQLLNQMKMLHRQYGVTKAKPNHETYHLILQLFATYHPKHVIQLQNLLHSFEQQNEIQTPTNDNNQSSSYDNNSDYLEEFPSLEMYQTVMDAWALSDFAKSASAKGAMAFLDHMHQYASPSYSSRQNNNQKHHPWMKPDERIYGAVMQAWSRSFDWDGPHMAQRLLEEMEVQHGILASMETYRYALLTCARSLRKNSPTLAYAIFQRAWQRYQNYITLKQQQQLQPYDNSYDNIIANTIQNTTPHNNNNIWRPTSTMCNILLNVFAKQGRAESCEEIFQKYYHPIAAPPNVITYTTLLQAWSKCNPKHMPHAPDRAMQIFYDLLRQYDNVSQKHQNYYSNNNDNKRNMYDANDNDGDEDDFDHGMNSSRNHMLEEELDLLPTALTYSALLNTWSRSERPDAAEQAEAIFNALVQGTYPVRRSATNYPSATATSTTTTDMNTALTSSTMDDNDNHEGHQEEETQGEYDHPQVQQQQYDRIPNLFHANALLNAFAKRGDGPRAEHFLHHRMPELQIQPCVISYNTVIHAWNRSKDSQAVERAQAIFDEISRVGLTPDRQSYGSMIAAWALCNNNKNNNSDEQQQPHPYRLIAAEQAQRIFDQLQQARAQNPANPRLLASNAECNALLDAWARHRLTNNDHPLGMSRAELELRRMVQPFLPNKRKKTIIATAGGTAAAAPTVFSSSPTTTPSCEDPPTLDTADDDDQRDIPPYVTAKPSTQCFNTVIAGYARQAKYDDRAPERAEALLFWMSELYASAEIGLPCLPSAWTFACVIQAWSESRHPYAVDRSYRLLREMLHRYELGQVNCQPRPFSFAAVLRTVVKRNNMSPSEKQDWARRILQDMDHLRVKPDHLVHRYIQLCEGNFHDNPQHQMDDFDGDFEQLHQ